MYVSHNPLASPLSTSQVLPYVHKLRSLGHEIWLVTFERGSDPASTRTDEVRWTPLQARPGSGLIAKMLDFLSGVGVVTRVVRLHDADVIHARSYLPAAIAAIAGMLAGRPFIFDMRGFLGDEYVESGHWRRWDVRYWLTRLAERLLLLRAQAVVVLTNRAEARLRGPSYRLGSVGRTPVSVIPCVVDLHVFCPRTARFARPTLVYSGSLGTWYMLDDMLRVFAAARELLPELEMLFLNRSERATIEAALRRMRIPIESVTVRSADPAEMPDLIARAHVGIALLRRVPSKQASSAVKVAEYLACGVPVVVNRGHGDLDELVSLHGAGHVMRCYSTDEIRLAAAAILRLVDDPQARSRARALAEAEYDLDEGVARYDAIYARFARGRSGRRDR